MTQERREKRIQLDQRIVDTLAWKMFGRASLGSWGCRVADIQVVSTLIESLVLAGELPPDTVPLCTWGDPARRCDWVLVYSDSFDEVAAGQECPQLLRDFERVERPGELGRTESLPHWAWLAVDAHRARTAR